MKKFLKFFTPFEWFLLLTIITLTIIASSFTPNSTFAESFFTIETLSAICGVINVVLAAKGHISNFAFGTIQCALYAFCCYRESVYGNAVLYSLYFLPMQFVGYFSWRKKLKSDGSNEVVSRFMNLRLSIIAYSITLAAIVALYFILKYVNGQAAIFDAASTVFNIVAMVMMVKGFTDQWYLWILVHISSLGIWAYKALKGDAEAVSPTNLIFCAMWFVYLLNSIHGLIVWKRNAVSNEEYKSIDTSKKIVRNE